MLKSFACVGSLRDRKRFRPVFNFAKILVNLVCVGKIALALYVKGLEPEWTE
jgi:hypothetical protein